MESLSAPSRTSPLVSRAYGSQASPTLAPSSPSVLTITEVCDRLKISRRQVYRCIDRGHLPPASHFLGRKALWPTAVIQDLEARWASVDFAELHRRRERGGKL
jgi:excisionase family DNA binding protein